MFPTEILVTYLAAANVGAGLTFMAAGLFNLTLGRRQ